MSDQPVVKGERASGWRNKLAQVVIVVFMLTALGVYVLALALAVHTIGQPFLGAFVEPTLVVSGVGDDDWNGRTAGLDLPDRLVEFGSKPLTHPRALYDELSRRRVNDVVTLKVEQPDGQRRSVVVELQSLPSSVVVSFFVVPYGIGLVYLFIGLMVFIMRRDRASGRAFPLFCTAFALSVGGLFDLYTTHRLMHFWAIGMSLLGGSLIDIALVFPRRSSLVLRWPWLPWLVYLPSVAILIGAVATTTNFNRPWAYIAAWQPMYLNSVLGMLMWMLMLLWRRRRAESPVVRGQARIVLLGILVGFTPVAIWLFLSAFQSGMDFQPPLLFAPLIALPLSLAYAILRYRLLDVDSLISRGVSYGLLTLFIVGGYLLLINLLSLLLGTAVETNNPVVVALFVFVVTLTLNPLRTLLHQSVDRLFYRDRINYRQELVAYSHELGRLLSESAIFAALAERIETPMHPERLLFYCYDEHAVKFVPAYDSQNNSEAVRFIPENSGLAHLLLERGESVYLREFEPLPAELAREAAQLEAVGALLYVPLTQHGWMALGKKRSGDPYTGDDLDFLEALGDQAGLALERVRLIDDLARRVNELDVLRRISQATNFSVGLDDLLELVYAQTSRVLDTTNFYIALHDEGKGTLSYAFYVVNNERHYPEDEWPLGVGLASEVIRYGQPIVTDDYMSECLRRGITPGGRAERAWMGVPLNVGDRVLGLMNVSSSDPQLTYAADRLEIFSAIADQAAAILDKTWLYEEMAVRARQLHTLNEVGSAINSTLELQTVLDLITEEAVQILEAEAGSLFTTDLETNELVFQVAVGPTASDLIGLRLAPGTGIVGATAETQKPIVVNDAQQDQRHFSGTDESSEFITRALLAVPLVSKGVSIGVLEVLNKKDGSLFDEQDKQVMMTFASQAAAAIENARLFTQTDQALAARVAELRMFQRIDHTLNETLDFNRVIELTLDWAMQMTDAEVGVVTTVSEDHTKLLVVANHGYPEDVKSWPVSSGITGRAVRTAEAQVVDDVTTDPDYVAAIPKTRSQLSVPIRMGDRVLGIITLESSEVAGFREDDVQLATRLADRAVVPIENAQLYEQVTKANEVKTQFVSMVAHELKVPMTSIGGYARLLELSDGPMDETKRGFIKTITSNVDRMDKTVSDLLDISRVERGRLKLDLEEISMADVIDETLDSLRGDIEEKDLALELTVPKDLPLVWGDRTRLVQVLINLVNNAVKYTLEGAIHIQAEALELPIPGDGQYSARWSGTVEDEAPEGLGYFVRCSVRDTGIGISEEDQERLFRSQFVRFENALDVAEGHGLGLWLVNRLVEMQGGQITFESKLNEGSTFAFTVPVADEQASSAA
jgi:signal transduction histidine kinase